MQNTSSAADELTTAHEYQRKAGRRMLCLMLILAVVLAVVLTAVSPRSTPSQAIQALSEHRSLQVLV